MQGTMSTKWMFCIIIVLAVIYRSGADTNGTCTRQKQITKTKLVSYTETYQETYTGMCQSTSLYPVAVQCTQYRTGQRIKYRTQKYTVYETEKICCTGFTKLANSCVPVCSQKCLNGNCTAPETCTCNEGFSKDLERNYTCTPICSKPCHNGNCSDPDTCTCNSGFSLDVNNKYSCNPLCSKPCINGKCTFPETCTCNNGYVIDLNNEYQCNPSCSKPCVNGKCNEPETCTCNLGYSVDLKDKYQCNPICSKSCVNSLCTTPEACSCLPGFNVTILDNVCEPICSLECINGFCSEPEMCECYEGYRKYKKHEWECKPVCNPKCFNGYCAEPGICKCGEGLHLGSDGFTCYANCLNGCNFGNCTNGACFCLEGWSGTYCNESIVKLSGRPDDNTSFLESPWMIICGVVGVLCLLTLTPIGIYWKNKTLGLMPSSDCIRVPVIRQPVLMAESLNRRYETGMEEHESLQNVLEMQQIKK